MIMMIITKKREITKRERNETQERQVMHGTIEHHLLLHAQPFPEQRSAPPRQLPNSLYTGNDVLWCGISFWTVWVSCPGLVPSWLLLQLLAGTAWDIDKSPI